MSTNWKDTSHDSGGIAYVYQLEDHELRFDPCHHRPADLLGGFIDRFCDGISVGEAPTTIRSSSSSTGLRSCYATSRCRYRLIHPGFPDSIVSDLNSVFTSKFWSPRYHFQAWLRLHPFELIARVSYKEDIILCSRSK